MNESLHDDKRNFGIQREKEGERENLSRKVCVNNRQHCECEKETLCGLKNREREREMFNISKNLKTLGRGG